MIAWGGHEGPQSIKPEGESGESSLPDAETDSNAKRRRLDAVMHGSDRRQHIVSEIYSPPRVAPCAPRYNLKQGVSLDLTTVDPTDGEPWDFSKQVKRDRARSMLSEQDLVAVIGSPECRYFSMLQHLRADKDSEEYKRAWAGAIVHIQFCCEVYEDQMKRGRYSVREHPAGASSWHLACVQRVLAHRGVQVVTADLCEYGLKSDDGKDSVKKPTKFMTNSPKMAQRLSRRCQGGHSHRRLMGGRKVTQLAGKYPPQALLRDLFGN